MPSQVAQAQTPMAVDTDYQEVLNVDDDASFPASSPAPNSSNFADTDTDFFHSTDKRLTSALNLCRRLPPSQISQTLNGLISLAPDLTEELLQRVDQPLKVVLDPTTSKQYLLCDYNRDADSYRSPWSNEYFPKLDDGFKPCEQLRALEIHANNVFSTYRQLYYEGGVSSCYLWENADDDEDDSNDDGAKDLGCKKAVLDNFAGCFLIKKVITEPMRKVSSGFWDSIHVVEVNKITSANSAGNTNKKGEIEVEFEYKLNTTINLSMTTKSNDKVSGQGTVNLCGSVSRQAKPLKEMIKVGKAGNVSGETHIENIGKMIETMEIDLRNQLDALYIQKTREIVNSIRKPPLEVFNDEPIKKQQSLVDDLTSTLKRRTK